MDSISQQTLVVVGSGFAGVWAALSAARQRRALGLEERIAIRVVSPQSYLGIRPRFYEADLAGTTVELARLFDPVGIEHVSDRAVGIDPVRRELGLTAGTMRYDALVWAAGSVLVRPAIAGAERLHSVDTFAEAEALGRHLRGLAADPVADAAAATVVVVGAGFTGLEAASELVGRLRLLFGGRATRVILIERADHAGPEFGPGARALIGAALADLGVEVRTGATVAAITDGSVALAGGDVIAARTVVWTAGVQANPATRWLGPAADPQGRLAVDATLRVTGHDAIWAAGDVACARVAGEHAAMMSCQHASPQGKHAGHNALRWLAGRSQRRYEQQLYVTCLDLGAWGALFTSGFERNRIVSVGDDARSLKRFINTMAIYPPLSGDARSLLRAAAPPSGGRVASAALRRVLCSRRLRSRLIARAAPASRAVQLAPATR